MCKESPETPNAACHMPEGASSSLSSAASCCDDGLGHDAIFFARVPPMVPYEDLHELFSRFGEVTDLNLFRRWQTAKTSKGCGIVKYSKHAQASAALLALNGVHTWDGYSGCEGPMVVEWMDASRLTSADAAAAHKAAKQREARAAAAANKTQHTPRPKGPSSSSSNINYSTTLPNWAYLHQLNALAQQNRSMAAAAAAAAAANAASCMLHPGGGFVGGPHPGSEVLDMSGFAGGPLSPERFNSGLGDPSTWNTVIPAHMLPMISQLQGAPSTSMGPTNLVSLSPMLPSAAAAAAYGQMKTNHMVHPSPAAVAAAAAAAAATQGGPSGFSGYEQMTGVPSGTFGCSTLNIEPWFSGGLASCSDGGSFTSPVPPPFAAGSASSFLQAAGLEDPQQQQQQQQFSPLMILDDAWGSQSFNALPPAAVTAAAAGQHTSSGTYGLFDSMSLLSQLNEAATAAGASAAANAVHSNNILSGANAAAAAAHSNSILSGANAVGGIQSSSILSCGANAAGASVHSNSFLSGPLAVVGGGNRDPVTGFLSGRLGGVMQQQECFSGTLGGGQDGFPTGRSGDQQQKGAVTVHMPLGDALAGQLVAHIPHISKMSGAEVAMVDNPNPPHGLSLRLQGSRAAVKAASNLVHLLSPWSDA